MNLFFNFSEGRKIYFTVNCWKYAKGAIGIFKDAIFVELKKSCCCNNVTRLRENTYEFKNKADENEPMLSSINNISPFRNNVSLGTMWRTS